jgi:Fe-S cluster assembly ATP-binding protein
MLELMDISFEKDNKKILKHINLKIDEKKFVAITGPNGSGKSTLAKIIMGIVKPTTGKIMFMGEDITDLNISERANLGIGFAFQQPVKFKGITVKDLIELSMNKEVKLKEACHYLSDVGLCSKDYLNREVNSSLSGGELKRIEIATVVAKKSKLTIFDEPEAGIDLWSFNNLIDVFQKMYNTIKGSIVIISHQERILNIADEIVLLNNGEITQVGSKDIILPKLLNKESNCKFLKELGSNG